MKFRGLLKFTRKRIYCKNVSVGTLLKRANFRLKKIFFNLSVQNIIIELHDGQNVDSKTVTDISQVSIENTLCRKREHKRGHELNSNFIFIESVGLSIYLVNHFLQKIKLGSVVSILQHAYTFSTGVRQLSLCSICIYFT